MGDVTRSVIPTLDGPVLAVLARSGRPLTAGEVAAQATRGSEIGIRRTLGRLVEQGIVRSHQMGRNRVHELNREHVAARIATLLADLRLELWRRLRAEAATWNPKPVYACVFGSAARADGNADSDIDLLVVHPTFPGEPVPKAELWLTAIGMLLTSSNRGVALPMARKPDRAAWQQQLDQLHSAVFSWTGNRLQVVDVSVHQWATGQDIDPHLLKDIKRDAVEVVPAWFPVAIQATPTRGRRDTAS
jgi:DNA-binding transcriptional ArsR family regulator